MNCKEYDLFIPTRYNDNKPIPGSIIDKIRDDLIQRFGGLTVFPDSISGFWKDDEGKVCKDEIVIFRVVADDGWLFMANLKAKLESLLCQEQIFIIVRDVEVM